MEPNENNLKPQPTGGLKLMTVFIAVLALHVVVIGGFTVWHLLYPSATETDLTADKTHKNKIMADSSIADMPADPTATDKSATSAPAASATPDSSASTTPADTASTTANPTTPADASASASETPAAGSTAAAESTASAPATTAAASTPTPPTMAEDASSAAANPPAPAPASVAAAMHPTAVTPATTPDLAPPADASATAADVTATTPAVAAGSSYTVKRGDSLARIARHHHLTLAALRAANNLKNDRLHIAQVLILPERAPKAAPADADSEALATPAPAANASGPMADSATTDTTSPTAPASSASVASTLTPHHAHKVATTSHHLYTVVKGDTLTKIAKRYHISTSAIVAANGLTNAGRLSIGQKLHIPSREARTAEDKPILAEPHGANRAQLANNLP